MVFKEKLNKIKSGQYKKSNFIIADAKDADMAFGCVSPGISPNGTPHSLKKYHDDIEKVVRSELADIMLMSVSNAEILEERNIFLNSNQF